MLDTWWEMSQTTTDIGASRLCAYALALWPIDYIDRRYLTRVVTTALGVTTLSRSRTIRMALREAVFRFEGYGWIRRTDCGVYILVRNDLYVKALELLPDALDPKFAEVKRMAAEFNADKARFSAKTLYQGRPA
jgi:hypothetical protein